MDWQRLKLKARDYGKNLQRCIAFALGSTRPLANRPGTRVVVFHGIDLAGNTTINSRFVSENYFESFLQYVRDHFNIISIEDLYCGNFKPDDFNLVITFDDGYLNNFELARPLLEKYGVPASFFITPVHDEADYLWPDLIDLVSYHSSRSSIDFLGRTFQRAGNNQFRDGRLTLKEFCKQQSFEALQELIETLAKDWQKVRNAGLDIYWKLMQPEHILSLSRHPLFSIGTHGLRHTNLVEITREQSLYEMKESKRILEDICSKRITDFAPPFGAYDERIIQQAKSIGYERLLLVDLVARDDEQDPLLQERMVVNPHLSLRHQIACILHGSYV